MYEITWAPPELGLYWCKTSNGRLRSRTLSLLEEKLRLRHGIYLGEENE
jgi:hypothetical protein